MAVNDIVMGAAGASGPATYIEDVFSTWLYTSSGSNRSIVNNIDLSTKGGMVLFKGRSGPGGNYGWGVFDTNRGVQKALRTNTPEASFTSTTSLTAFNADGFNLGVDNELYVANAFGSGGTASWTFRKQPKFFDIVTYTGNAQPNRAVPHNLGSIPGCIIVKPLNLADDWKVWHKNMAATSDLPNRYLKLNDTNAVITDAGTWGSTYPTSTNFYVDNNNNNGNGVTYVAYVFAHDAGGFGLTGTDNVISCGSFTTNGSGNATVNIGYEPQWLLTKCASNPGYGTNWSLLDIMRGWTASAGLGNVQANLIPNLSNAESNNNQFQPNATGFNVTESFPNSTIIYIAIRRPMKTPTTGTSVFGISARTGTNANATVTSGTLPDDAVLIKNRGAAVASLFSSRLTGTGYLVTSTTAAEVAAGGTILQTSPWDVMDGVKVGTTSTITNASGNTFVNYLFARAPGFMDVVCYTGTSSARTVAHNLTVVPELMIVKGRSSVNNWIVYSAPLGNTKGLVLNGTNAPITTINWWNNTTPTASVFTVGAADATNLAGATLVAYLFATVAGVSKVGSYTGNGSSQTINCAFTTGARFIMIKRTDSTGDWYVWDSARGIVAGNDPRLSLNTTAAEVTTDDSVDADSSGFIVNQLAATDINVSSATYIFLSIA